VGVLNDHDHDHEPSMVTENMKRIMQALLNSQYILRQSLQ